MIKLKFYVWLLGWTRLIEGLISILSLGFIDPYFFPTLRENYMFAILDYTKRKHNDRR